MTPQKVTTYVLVFFLIIILLWSALLTFTGYKTTSWNYGFNFAYALFYMIGGVIGVWGAKSIGIKNNLGKAFVYFGLGLASFSLAIITWAFYNFYLMIEIPYPSLADVFFIAFYPLTFLGLLYLIRAHSEVIKTTILVESLIILAVNAIAILAFTNLLPRDLTQGRIANIFNSIYPVGDILIASTAFIVFRISVGRMHRGLMMLVAAFVIGVIADLLFAFRTSTHAYWNGDISDVLYAIGGFLFALGLINAMSGIFNNPLDPDLKR
jgi:hypothetical protein